MKSSFRIAVLGLVLSPMLALAASTDTPTPVKPDPTNMGHLDALYSVCAKVDKEHRATYQRLRSENIVMGEGTPTERRVEGSDTPEYKKAYAELTEASKKAAPEVMINECIRVVGIEVAGSK